MVANQNTRNGGDGGWLRRCGLSTSGVSLTVDEDTDRDTERQHTTERAGVFILDGTANDYTNSCGAAPTIDYFQITVAAVGNTCAPLSFTVTAIDSNGATMENYQGTVTISASTIVTNTLHGNINDVTAENDTVPGPDTDNNGSVQYTFADDDDGVIVLELEYDLAETVDITVVDNAVSSTSSTSGSIAFSDSGFVITDVDTDMAGDDIAVAGRNHLYKVELIKRDRVTDAACGVATSYLGDRDLKLWRTGASDPTTVTPTFGGNDLPTSEPVATNGSLTFVAGVADNVVLGTGDVGQFEINLADASLDSSPDPIVGASNTVTVRPFGLAIENIQGLTANPANDTSGGIVFAVAGAPFSAQVEAVLWAVGDDSDNDGLIDSGASFNNNSKAAGYAWDTVLDADAAGFEPSSTGGAVGDLLRNENTNVIITEAEFTTASGTVTPTDLQYDEVGSFTIKADASGYLGRAGADVASDLIIVGRFRPAKFSVAVDFDGSFENICLSAALPADRFTYIGQNFSYATPPAFTVTALSARDTPMGNYIGGYSKLNFASITIDDLTSDTTTNGTDGVKLDVSFTKAFGMFVTKSLDGTASYIFNQDTFRYGPDDVSGAFSKASNSEVPAFTADIDINLSGVTDGEVNTTSLVVPFDVAGNQQRFGRVRMENAYGSELVNLQMPMLVEYLDATSIYVQNNDDSCTTIANDVTEVIRTGALSTTVLNFNTTAVMGDMEITLDESATLAVLRSAVRSRLAPPDLPGKS